MKEILGILRSAGWVKTRRALEAMGIVAVTSCRVLGRGRQRGLAYLPRQGAQRISIEFLPRRMESWVVEDDQVDAVIQVIVKTNQTGQFGDGKVFVLPVGETIRIRTGERLYAARQ